MKAVILAIAMALASVTLLPAAHAQTEAAASAPLSEGEIRKVDAAAGKITIKHGPLENLGMPGMTMVFRVKDSAWLEQLKAGDKIRFQAEKVNGLFTVVRYEAVK